jgi:nitrite reductase/ring-hydroxylating ferredoxin subunit/uncharacterized membrane protein
MDSTKIATALDRQDWIDPAASVLETAAGNAYEAAGPTGAKIADLLHGVWLGHPLHPVLTDIPLGAWTAAAVLDLMDTVDGRKELRPGADAAIGVGLIGAFGAAASGLTDWYILGDVKSTRRVGSAHAMLNITATALYGASWLLRRRKQRGAGKAASLLGYAVVCAAAYLGGMLVYDQKIGVDHAERENLPAKFVAMLPESELAEGELKRVEVNGVKILLARKNGKVHALGEVCSHLGGSLADGKLDGDCVVCSWHFSKFALKDGAVVEGPATYPQPALETRIRSGKIEVRAAKAV